MYSTSIFPGDGIHEAKEALKELKDNQDQETTTVAKILQTQEVTQQSSSNTCQQLNSNIQHQHYMYAPPVSQSPDIVSPLLHTSGTMSPSVPNTTPVRHQNSRSQMTPINIQFPVANHEQSPTCTCTSSQHRL